MFFQDLLLHVLSLVFPALGINNQLVAIVMNYKTLVCDHSCSTVCYVLQRCMF